MSVVRVGTSSKYASGWDAVFGGGKPRASGRKNAAAASPAKRTAGKKSAAKKAVKPVAKKAAKKAGKRR